jgi:hypothetical protein
MSLRQTAENVAQVTTPVPISVSGRIHLSQRKSSHDVVTFDVARAFVAC